MAIYEKRSILDVDPATLFAWHTRPGAFERLSPPWERLQVLARYGGITDGARVTLLLSRGPMRIRWEVLHRGFVDGVQFQDVMVAGPFKRWVHTHRVEPASDGRATLIDHVDYALPFGPLGALATHVFPGRALDRLFAFRHRRIATDLARHRAIGQGRRLRLVLTGRADFMLGQLAAFLSTGGHLVHVFPTTGDARVGPANRTWGPTAVPDQAALEQADVVLHVGLDALGDLLTTLETRRSRARAVVALPTVATPGAAPVTTQALEAAIAGTHRRVVALLTPGVLVARTALDGLAAPHALTPSVDGALVGLDDLIGAAHYAACDDGVQGIVDITIRRAGQTAAVPSSAARWVPDVGVVQLESPAGDERRRLTDEGFAALNPSIDGTILSELGWP